MSTIAIQRVENLFVVIVALVVAVLWYPSWWWVLFAAFLAFDLSAIGYLRSPRAGAACYNSVHTYVWPGALAVLAISTAGTAPNLSMWAGIVACAWAFHVGVDRMLGFGLKLPTAFTHTHLGRIGKTTEAASTGRRL